MCSCLRTNTAISLALCDAELQRTVVTAWLRFIKRYLHHVIVHLPQQLTINEQSTCNRYTLMSRYKVTDLQMWLPVEIQKLELVDFAISILHLLLLLNGFWCTHVPEDNITVSHSQHICLQLTELNKKLLGHDQVNVSFMHLCGHYDSRAVTQ